MNDVDKSEEELDQAGDYVVSPFVFVQREHDLSVNIDRMPAHRRTMKSAWSTRLDPVPLWDHEPVIFIFSFNSSSVQ